MNQQNAYTQNPARKYVVWGGVAILAAITILSCVSSFVIYKGGFADMPPLFQNVLALAAVLIVEGAFVWLVFGFTRAFSSAAERIVSIIGMIFLVAVMLINLVTHFMMVKGIELNAFQQGWIAWGAVMVFIAVLLIVLFITLGDPVIRLMRMNLRYQGKADETLISAKTGALQSDVIQTAMEQRAQLEAGQLAARITGAGQGSGPASRPVYGNSNPRRPIGYGGDAEGMAGAGHAARTYPPPPPRRRSLIVPDHDPNE